MEEILNILDKEKGNVSRAKIAQMLGMEEKEVADKIEKMEKENVIVGRLIPAGTGLAYHRMRKDSASGSDLPMSREVTESSLATDVSGGGA